MEHKNDKCKKCGETMKPGKAIKQTWSAGGRDFAGDLRGITMSPGGAGKLIDCMKCEKCGWSTTSDAMLTCRSEAEVSVEHLVIPGG